MQNQILKPLLTHDLENHRPSATVGVGSGAMGTMIAGAAKATATAGVGKGVLAGIALMAVAPPLAAGVTIGVIAGILHSSNRCRYRRSIWN